MSKPFEGVISIDVRDSVPDWKPYEQPKAPEGAPNVLVIVWDDTGFGALQPFGGPIEVPTMQKLADGGLRYTQFHTTALCQVDDGVSADVPARRRFLEPAAWGSGSE